MLDIYKDITNIINTSLNLFDDLRNYLDKNFLGYVVLQDIKSPDDITTALENILVEEMTQSINNHILAKLIPGYKHKDSTFSMYVFLVDNKTFTQSELLTYLEDKYFYIQTIYKINNIYGRI